MLRLFSRLRIPASIDLAQGQLVQFHACLSPGRVVLVQQGDEALGRQLLLDAVVGGFLPAQGVTQFLVADRAAPGIRACG